MVSTVVQWLLLLAHSKNAPGLIGYLSMWSSDCSLWCLRGFPQGTLVSTDYSKLPLV